MKQNSSLSEFEAAHGGLCEFEVELLEAMDGLRPAFPWGAAVGQALECLEGSGHVVRSNGRYVLTEKGERVARTSKDH